MKRKLKPYTKMGEALINYIEKHGMNMESFASRTGLPYSSVNQWVVGRSTKAGRITNFPNFKQLVRLQKTFPDLAVLMLEAGA